MTVGGARVRAFRVEIGVEVAVLAGDREVGPVRATVVIVPGEDEVVLRDIQEGWKIYGFTSNLQKRNTCGYKDFGRKMGEGWV